MTNNELKKVARMGLRIKYGFTAKLVDIILLEADHDGSYVMFAVNGHEYQVRRSRVWIGNGQSETKYDVKKIEED